MCYNVGMINGVPKKRLFAKSKAAVYNISMATSSSNEASPYDCGLHKVLYSHDGNEWFNTWADAQKVADAIQA